MLANGVKRGEHHCVMASSQQLLSGELNALPDVNMDSGFACDEVAGAPE
jgi:hypothetical protein